jgi:hypothetical protein
MNLPATHAVTVHEARNPDAGIAIAGRKAPPRLPLLILSARNIGGGDGNAGTMREGMRMRENTRRMWAVGVMCDYSGGRDGEMERIIRYWFLVWGKGCIQTPVCIYVYINVIVQLAEMEYMIKERKDQVLLSSRACCS